MWTNFPTTSIHVNVWSGKTTVTAISLATTATSKNEQEMDLMRLRIGIGHDTHRLQPGGLLMLGGLEIEHDQSLIGHSDADVLLHAITDAILGAAGLGDIGELFPNTDPENQNRDSGEMLRIAAQACRDSGYEIVNVDCILHAQRPKLSPYKSKIADNIGRLLDIESTRVGVKAKTGESVGPVGTEEAMQAEAVALLVKTDDDQP